MIEDKKIHLWLSISLTTLLMSGCGIDNTDENIVGEGKFIKVTPLFDINASTMQPTVTSIAPGQPAFGIKGYRVVYHTKDERGNDINASGLITVPVPSDLILSGLKAQNKNYSMSIVSNQHGTIFPDVEAPTSSVIATHKPTSIGTLFSAVGGFMTIQPDYIGFGESVKENHPYLLEKASANSVIDMLEAAIKFGNDNTLPLNGQVFLTGYSEGGYVTLAAAKEIETNHPDIKLKGLAPMSGPYDLNLTGMGVLSQTEMSRPDFIAGIVYSYATDLDLGLENIVNAQYASKLPTLYDAQKTGEEIRAELTTSIADFFTPTYRGDFLTNPNNTLRQAFVENSVDDWKPTTPTKLLYCSGDTTIDYRISLSAGQKMGIAPENMVDINSSLGHAECAIPAYGATLKWFSELRSK
jgi:pimeloyl-ACP methyl ester carboxylesterase